MNDHELEKQQEYNIAFQDYFIELEDKLNFKMCIFGICILISVFLPFIYHVFHWI